MLAQSICWYNIIVVMYVVNSQFTVYCKSIEVEKFHSFRGSIGNHKKTFAVK